jgi:hypothetical protein
MKKEDIIINTPNEHFLTVFHHYQFYAHHKSGHSLSIQSNKHTAKSTLGRGMLLPIHFACDLKELGTIAGNEGTNQYFQFRRMASVCVWLLMRVGGECLKPTVSQSNITNIFHCSLLLKENDLLFY